MGVHACENARAAGAAKRRCHIAVRKRHPLIEDQALRVRHVFHGVKTLVVCNNDQKIRALIVKKTGNGLAGLEGKDPKEKKPDDTFGD